MVLLSIRKNLVFEGAFLNLPFWSGPSVFGPALGISLSCSRAKEPSVSTCWLRPTVCAIAVHLTSWLPYKIRTTHEVDYSLLQHNRNHIVLIYCFLFCLLIFEEAQEYAPMKGHTKLCIEFNNFIYKGSSCLLSPCQVAAGMKN